MNTKKEQTAEQNLLEYLGKRDEEKRSKIFNLNLRRTAQEIRDYKLVKKMLAAVAFALAIVITAFFVTALMYSKFSSFTVSVSKFNQNNASLQISETVGFENPTNRLTCPAIQEITNIAGTWIDMNEVGSVDGEDNGDNYLCYTFYIRNNGDVKIHVKYYMTLANITNNLDEAVRIRLCYSRDGAEREITDYAKAAGVDEFGQKVPEEGTVMFEDKHTVMTEEVDNIKPGEVLKFTVVIWIEGPDKDCLDDKIGGLMETDMQFEVYGIGEA